MRVSINSPLASLVVDLKEEQVLELMREVLDKVSGKVIKSTPPIQEVAPKIQVPVVEKVTPPAPPEPVKKAVKETTTPQEPKEYKGFLYIECEECGNFKSFMPKTPISQFICDCGHKTALRDMKELYVDCKCGAHFKYMTNAKESVIAINCFKCGSPVDLEYHGKNNNYQTIK